MINNHPQKSNDGFGREVTLTDSYDENHEDTTLSCRSVTSESSRLTRSDRERNLLPLNDPSSWTSATSDLWRQ
ncbi:hypothetical protein F2P81_008370 [Scophthalmus maximus]|uniref:Uncharacterized protein n=1 Tax=Scophthalmus maximus TaxID=52904 RepID=A0A6A4T4U5_SCOMX|nr:hypothetical protein F2P81_008370 [Scophthalmus maximus]